MRLSQDIEVGYSIRGQTHYRRRAGILVSPRRGGGTSNWSRVRGDKNAARQLASAEKSGNGGDKNISAGSQLKYASPDSKKGIKENNANVHSRRPLSAPSRRVTPSGAPPDEHQHRVRRNVELSQASFVWDKSTKCPDREHLTLTQDNEISKSRKDTWGSMSRPPSATAAGRSHENDRKTIASSYSRCRTSKTSGPVVNLQSHLVGRSKEVEEHIEDLLDTGIHDVKWNVSTKDKDEEERAKPAIIPSKSSKHLKQVYYSKERTKSRQMRGTIVDTNQPLPKGKWEDVAVKATKTDRQSYQTVPRLFVG
mmetsp:Transcript_9919/g.14933  ORF Transcript_9919/g.14933 Transcript_9919/m.14933 type:complete len:309 (-) Transcript_9919:425-1351(-)|eukprot:CAMPEP_0185035326 /NCGR_PEP_ID=MMETSP1103-20130426/26516_1 /TAXON_ID=36769 /ORGANISM="Paraphysomonas bandaiensis, Strain Caron Lab Isolate" /LENGTH=308 /DNA_ID=CAMNT_0027572353 /DNA_START=74 /DNA_END=1000 /DNA_ORIENTATION=+